MKPVVSVVVPVYNGALHLEECLNSILNQSLQAMEVICVDDGSTDSTLEILQSFAGRDPRVKVLTQENCGPGPARNLGMTFAQGTYLIFLDADDLYENRLLETMVQRAEQTGADLVISNSNIFSCAEEITGEAGNFLRLELLNGRTQFSPRELSENLFQLVPGWPWDKLFRREFVEKHRLEYPALPNSQDLVFIFPAMALAEKICVVEEILIHHRVNRKTSVSNSRSRAVEAPWQAACLLRKILEEKGCFARYEQGYLCWAMNFFIWHLNTLTDPAAQKVCYDKMRREWFPNMGFRRYPASIYGKSDYWKYQLIRLLPYKAYALLLKAAHGR